MRKINLNALLARNEGVSLLELIVVLGLIGILATTATSSIGSLDSPLSNAAFSSSHYLRLARARAISTTSFVRVAPTSTSTIVATTGDSCTATQTVIDNLSMNYDEGVTLGATDWHLCFTPRGLSDEHITFSFSHESGTKTIEVALGGGIRVE